jgi:hypothetical protein
LLDYDRDLIVYGKAETTRRSSPSYTPLVVADPD